MPAFLHSSLSVVHLLAVGVALLAGTAIVRTPKATRQHRRLGRVYVVSMAVLLLTAFHMYFLFGRFGVVHWGAVGSTLALGIGVGAVLCQPVLAAWRLVATEQARLRKRFAQAGTDRKQAHRQWMYYSPKSGQISGSC